MQVSFQIPFQDTDGLRRYLNTNAEELGFVDLLPLLKTICLKLNRSGKYTVIECRQRCTTNCDIQHANSLLSLNSVMKSFIQRIRTFHKAFQLPFHDKESLQAYLISNSEELGITGYKDVFDTVNYDIQRQSLSVNRYVKSVKCVRSFEKLKDILITLLKKIQVQKCLHYLYDFYRSFYVCFYLCMYLTKYMFLCLSLYVLLSN